MADAVSVSSEESTPWDYELTREIILRELDDTGGLSSFAYASKVTTAPNPGLSVEGIGGIGLPLGEQDAQALISKCCQSPFGKGGATVVDTDVRNSFELNPSQFSIRNPAWKACINALVDIVYRELALKCARQNVTAELYKLLLYQEGAFFKSHQDSEKTAGMFGTLVVCLPSDHQGGTVILRHRKDEYQFDSAKTSGFDTTFAAWYSDVFHEVQKVTRGYRLVLTYNLVQRGSSIPQKAPEGDGLRTLTDCLQQYNKGLEAEPVGSKDWPSFLAYTLEHTYSQAGLRLCALKGVDFDRVERLKAVSDKIGFDLYLALKEKVLHKDDDCGSEVFDREENFKYVLDLDGNPHPVAPKYEALNLLDDGTATDDEEPDEEEHQGYTGNEGAPAQYWYRTSMVLIVPPARKVDFCLDTEDNGFAAPLKLIKEYRARNPASGSYDAQQFSRLCTLVIRKSQSPQKWLYPYSRYNLDCAKLEAEELECMQEIATVTLERNWYYIYTMLHGKWKFGQTSLEALGFFLASHGHEPDKLVKLKEMLEEQTDLQLHLKALKWIDMGLTNGDAPQAVKDAVRSMARDALRRILVSTAPLRKDAGETLAAVLTEYGTDLEGDLLKKLGYCTTPTAAAFVLRYAHSTSDHALLVKMLRHLWTSTFAFEGPEIRKTATTAWGVHQALPSERDVLTFSDLVNLLTVSHQHGAINALDGLPVLQAALPNITPAYAKIYLLPFTSSIINRGISILFTSGDPIPDARVTAFITASLKSIINKCIGPKPQRSVNFTLPPGSCNCKDCSTVNEFLASSTRTQLDFPCGKNRRLHLHRNFTDKSGEEYAVETLRHQNPNVWRITKTVGNKAKKQREEWKENVSWLDRELTKLARVQCGLLSEEVLGKEMYRGIMGCTVESLKAAEQAMPLTESNANSKKRKTGEGAGKGAKKAKGMSWPGGVEVVDLT